MSIADERWEARAAQRRLHLMDLHEPLAVQAETQPCPELRAAYAERYRRLIGVLPCVRQEYREALEGIRGISVENLSKLFQPPYAPNSPDGGS